MLRKLLMLVMTLTLGIGIAYADVPRTINYQGRLTALNGTALADGAWAITIRLYNNATDAEGSSIWSDNYSVQTRNGYFNIVLGSNPSFPLNLVFDKQYYLGIKVGTDAEMTPRQPLQSVPYALNVATEAFPGYLLSNIRTLTIGTTSYVPAAGVRAILVECVGAGGGGGGAAYGTSQYGAGGGGGAGAYARKWIVSPAASYQVSIGTKGTGGPAGANNGTLGGATVFGSPAIITCNGGGGAQGSGAATGPTLSANGGTGGIAAGGDMNVTGYDGYIGIILGSSGVISGYGGSSNFGKGGKTQVHGATGYDGQNASGYGSGGSGGSAIPSTDRKGGDGADGVIVIWEYK